MQNFSALSPTADFAAVGQHTLSDTAYRACKCSSAMNSAGRQYARAASGIPIPAVIGAAHDDAVDVKPLSSAEIMPLSPSPICGPAPSEPPQASSIPRLHTGIPRLDKFFEGIFACGQITLLDGPAEFILELISRFAVTGVVTFGRPVMFIDGGNTADPYGFSTVCRRLHVDPRAVLARIFIARAFTVYQLDTLFAQMVEERINALGPAVVIISSLNDMYLDPDVNWDEARMIFKNDMEIIREFTAKHGLMTLVANHGHHKSYHAMELVRSLRTAAGQRIEITVRSKHKLRMVRNGSTVMDYRPLPPYQCSLDEFLFPEEY